MTAPSRLSVSGRRAIDPAVIDLWVVALDAPAADVLSADEVARAERFVFERDRRRFIACRSALRQVLSGYAGVSPRALAFAYGDKGKPALDGPGGWLRFNVSHAEECAVIGVSRAGELGVDIECTTRTVEFEGLANRFFSPVEAAELGALPAGSRRQAFFNCWTRKEAYIKAIGEGLACPLQSFVVTLEPGVAPAFRSIEGDSADAWRLWAFSPLDRYVGAVATRATVDAIRLRQFEPDASALPHRRGAGASSEAWV